MWFRRTCGKTVVDIGKTGEMDAADLVESLGQISSPILVPYSSVCRVRPEEFIFFFPCLSHGTVRCDVKLRTIDDPNEACFRVSQSWSAVKSSVSYKPSFRGYTLPVRMSNAFVPASIKSSFVSTPCEKN